ncbi:hypothetical protein M0R72_00785 [Candidatus Pacearchaeota archaeon]|jgi:hypothetical protein|nr:hypothetical protein [Candidatus Pacearchaeota archaeon]
MDTGVEWSCHIEIGEKIEELRLELCKQLYTDLEADYYSSISDEECLNYLRARRFVIRDGLEKLITDQVPCEGVQVI